MSCKHLRGDYLSTYWLCADCFEKMDRRPVKYRMVRSPAADFLSTLGSRRWSGPEKRQEISWQAAVVISKEGYSFGKFIMLVSERFVRKGKMDKQEAVDMAIEAMKSLSDLGDKFGDADFSWDRYAAYTIADEEMSYWDFDGDGSNA